MILAVASFDAGSSNLISAWLLHQRIPIENLHLFIDGPAVSVFNRLLPSARTHPIGDVINYLKNQKPDLLLTGTDWGTQVQKMAWKIAKERRIKSAIYLDGFNNLVDPFYLNNELVCPDEVWIHDERLKEKISFLNLAPHQILVKPDLHLENIVKNILSLKVTQRKDLEPYRVLYLCENITAAEATFSARTKLRGYTEISALEYFLQNVGEKKFELPHPFEIRLRPHPSETSEKYQNLVNKFSHLPIQFSSKATPIENDIAWSEMVVGCESTGMIIADHCQKKVVSVIPPTAKLPFRLPYSNIEQWSPLKP